MQGSHIEISDSCVRQTHAHQLPAASPSIIASTRINNGDTAAIGGTQSGIFWACAAWGIIRIDNADLLRFDFTNLFHWTLPIVR